MRVVVGSTRQPADEERTADGRREPPAGVAADDAIGQHAVDSEVVEAPAAL